MNKYIIVFLLLSNIAGYSQSDCVIQYVYKGIIVRKDVSDTTEIKLLLPSTQVLSNYKKKEAFYDSIKINPHEREYCKEFISHLSSVFCNSSRRIINDYFKSNREYYTVIVKYDANIIMKEISVKEIKFKIRKDKVYIGLPIIVI